MTLAPFHGQGSFSLKTSFFYQIIDLFRIIPGILWSRQNAPVREYELQNFAIVLLTPAVFASQLATGLALAWSQQPFLSLGFCSSQWGQAVQGSQSQPSKYLQPKSLSLLCYLSFSFSFETGSQVSQASLTLSV